MYPTINHQPSTGISSGARDAQQLHFRDRAQLEATLRALQVAHGGEPHHLGVAETGHVDDAAEDLYDRLHSLSKSLEGSGRLDALLDESGKSATTMISELLVAAAKRKRRS